MWGDNATEIVTHLSFLLTNHNGSFEMNMDNNQQLVIARLEKYMPNVAEQHI